MSEMLDVYAAEAEARKYRDMAATEFLVSQGYKWEGYQWISPDGLTPRQLADAALSHQPEARGVVDAPPFQRWSMTKGSDGKRWSVCMDHDPCGEWVKWIDVQQHFFVAAITEARNG